MGNAIETRPTLADMFIKDVEREVTAHAAKLLRGMEGRAMAPYSKPMAFRFPSSDRATDTFQSYVYLYDQVPAPAAILWPMRIGGGLATNPAQRRYMAIELRLATEVRHGYCDPDTDRPVTWLMATDPRAIEIRKCIELHREEEPC